MTEEIIRKLTAELDKAITSEVQVLYLLAGIRKLIERDDLGTQYPALNFHCDWALHSKLDRSAAQAILGEFDEAHRHLKNAMHLLPELGDICKMRTFEKELTGFLERYGLPPIAQDADGWSHFFHLYTQVIQDIPLMVKASSPDAARNISKVVVHVEAATRTQKFDDREEFFYRIVWEIFDKNSESGTIAVDNSFGNRMRATFIP